jgi:hypothetical protein
MTYGWEQGRLAGQFVQGYYNWYFKFAPEYI